MILTCVSGVWDSVGESSRGYEWKNPKENHCEGKAQISKEK